MVAHRDKEHEFALYYSGLSELVGQKDTIKIVDTILMHRMIHVLRLQRGDVLVLFDQRTHARATIEQVEKKSITCIVQDALTNRVIQPHVAVWLPLLKREAFEEAIYALIELGVNAIHLMHTAKEQRHWTGPKEMQRIHNIMIAAAEQSKNFAMAQVYEPKNIADLIAQKSNKQQGFFFDVMGNPLLDVVKETPKHDSYIVCVGPEGDLLESEKFLLQKSGFTFARLTPTVLRAQQAVVVGLGALRSLL